MTKPINLLEKPSWAAYVWADDDSIWVELPCPTGKAPVLVQYSITEAGFAKALSLIRQNANVKHPAPLPGHFKAYHEARAKPPSTAPLANFTKRPELRTAIAAALKKVGLV